MCIPLSLHQLVTLVTISHLLHHSDPEYRALYEVLGSRQFLFLENNMCAQTGVFDPDILTFFLE
jgi:hypothetical protein